MTQAEEELKQAVGRAATADVTAALRRLYDDLAGEIDAHRPRCDASGRCCRFDSYGHRLYVTALELGAFVHQLKAEPHASADTATSLPILQDACVFQTDGLCGVHAIRPFGCRIFFCDPASEVWQYDAYERFHVRLKALHETFGVPYHYVEWRAALHSIGVHPPSKSSITTSLPRHAGGGEGRDRTSNDGPHPNPPRSCAPEEGEG